MGEKSQPGLNEALFANRNLLISKQILWQKSGNGVRKCLP